MEPNYYNNSKPTTSRFGKQISMPQISLLNRSMIVAGIGFLSIGILGFLAAYLIINVVNSGSEGTLLLLYFLFMILVLVSQFMAMFAFNRIESLSKAKIATIFVMYGIGQGIGFGFLFAALQMQFDSVSRAISYITLAFTAGGLAFLTAGYIGKKLSVQGTMTLGRYLMYLSIGFIAISFL
jgi:preprotein translocase subunit Sss1